MTELGVPMASRAAARRSGLMAPAGSPLALYPRGLLVAARAAVGPPPAGHAPTTLTLRVALTNGVFTDGASWVHSLWRT
jgi:hypothetical protein